MTIINQDDSWTKRLKGVIRCLPTIVQFKLRSTLLEYFWILSSSFIMINTDSRSSLTAFTFLVFMSAAACLSSPDANKCSRAQDCNAGNGSYECCSGSCVQGSSCLGENCEINRDCSTAEICCDTKCVDSLDCKGQTCSFDNDCQTDEVCCYGSCREKVLCSDYTLIILICPVAIIAFVSISSCVFRRICFKTSISMKRYPFSHGFSSESTSSRSLISLPRPLTRTHLFYTPPRRVNLPVDFQHKVAKICEGPKSENTTQYGSFRETLKLWINTFIESVCTIQMVKFYMLLFLIFKCARLAFISIILLYFSVRTHGDC